MSPAKRWLDRLQACDTPVVRLWLWPEGGFDEVFRRLAEKVECQELDGQLGLVAALDMALDQLESGDSDSASDLIWLWTAEAPLALADLEHAIDRLPPGQRLIFVEHQRRPLGLLPVTTVPPAASTTSATQSSPPPNSSSGSALLALR